MALPAEPRQKMINIMYLVLTALLALNVSSEILNAFRVVNGSLGRSNTNLTETSTAIYNGFEAAKKEPKTAEKANQLAPLAYQVRDASVELQKIIDDFRKKVEDGAKGYGPDGKLKKEDDLGVGSRIMLTEKGGDALYAAIQAYQTKVQNIMGVEFKAAFPNGTPLEDKGIKDGKDLAVKNFNMQPAVANLTMLAKTMNDLKNTEASAVKHLFQKIDGVVLKYDKFEAFASASSTYVMPNQDIVVTAGLGAFNSSERPTISINGQSGQANENGVLERTIKAGSANGSINVTVSYKDPNTGQMKTANKVIQYEVGKPGSSSVSADYMAVLYLGVDNKVSVGSSAGWDKTNVNWGSINGITGSNGRYMIKPSGEPRDVKIVVTSDKTPSSFDFRVRRLPPASVFCAGQKSGPISTAALIAQGGITAKLENSDFAANYSVVSYKVTTNGKNGYQEAQNSGNRWSGSAATLIAALKPGSSVTFENIKIQGPDGQVRPAANEVLSFYCR